jgi:hypothetical protein
MAQKIGHKGETAKGVRCFRKAKQITYVPVFKLVMKVKVPPVRRKVETFFWLDASLFYVTPGKKNTLYQMNTKVNEPLNPL